MKKLLFLSLALIATAALAGELAIGADTPKFTLTSAADGKSYTFDPGSGKNAVVVFTCNQCPYSRAFEERIVTLGREYAKKGIAFYAINPNDDVAYPEETMEQMKSRAKAKNYPFPYLKDGDSRVARAYGARVTPHVFVVDSTGKVRYRGYVDDSAKADEREHAGLAEALDALLENKEVQRASTKAFGCSIKWKS